jgi:hypothetical protein
MPGLRWGMAVAIIALHLVTGGMARAVAVAPQLAAENAAKDKADDKDHDKADDKDKADEAKPGEPADAEAGDAESPGFRRVEVTGYQCEALAMGRSIKDLPPDTKVEAISFTDPPPITYRLPEQRRESLTECTLRASGLSVRVDKSRNVITLLPSGTGSPEMPNPKVKLRLKLSEEPATPEK